VTGNFWQTPELVLEHVRAVDEIALDPCTNSTNPTRAKRIITPEQDPHGLLADWWVIADGGLAYCNPPYGRGHAHAWAAKIVHEAELGCEIIALTRGDLSTRWARMMLDAARAVCFPPRIKFKGATGSPNFSNAIFYFGTRPITFDWAFSDLGPVVQPTPRSPRSAFKRNEQPTTKGNEQ